jgi:hypothetical protein
VELLQTFFLVLLGLVLLVLSLAGVTLGSFMALERRNREPGVFFAIWWVPAIAASLGIIMRDSVTFVVGTVCFIVAGVALAVGLRGARSGAQKETKSRTTGSTGTKKLPLHERAKRWAYDKIKEYRKVIS